MMLVEETTVPTEALPVAKFKEHMRLGTGFADDAVQDELLEAHLRAALAAIEARTGKILLSRSFSWNTHQWRDGDRQPLPVAPIEVITALTLVDAQGTEVIVADNQWSLEQDTHRPHLVARARVLPTIPPRGIARLSFIAGFGPAWGDLPGDIAQAAFLLAAHFYEFRHDSSAARGNIPFGVSALIAPHRSLRMMLGGRS